MLFEQKSTKSPSLSPSLSAYLSLNLQCDPVFCLPCVALRWIAWRRLWSARRAKAAAPTSKCPCCWTTRVAPEVSGIPWAQPEHGTRLRKRSRSLLSVCGQRRVRVASCARLATPARLVGWGIVRGRW